MAKSKGLLARLLASISIRREGDVVTITRDHRSGCVALFMGVWLTGWTAGCCALTWALIAGQGNIPWLFPIPFYLGEIAGIAAFVGALTHKEYLRLDRDGLTIWHSAIVRWNKKTIPLDEIDSISAGERTSTSDNEPSIVPYLKVEGANPSFPWLENTSPDDLQEAAQELGDCLKLLKATTPPSKSVEPKRPSECRWTREFSFENDCLTLTRREPFQLGATLTIFGIAAFWNSIVGVFVGVLFGWVKPDNGNPQGIEWWFLFFFLIPFEAIGVGFICAVVYTAMLPLWRESWRLYRNRMVRRISLFGIGTETVFENIDFDRLDCLPEEKESKGSPGDANSSAPEHPAQGNLAPFSPSDSSLPTTAAEPKKPPMTFFPDGQPIEVNRPAEVPVNHWKLAFVKRDQSALVEWKGLSFGEAQWLGSVVLETRSGWFAEK